MCDYDFTSIRDRRFTGSSKWIPLENIKDYHQEIIPLSVADMEFVLAPEIVEGLKNFLDKGSLGYSHPWASYYEAVVMWLKERHQVEVEKDWIVMASGVVSAIEVSIEAFSEVGEGVVITTPLYPPFARSIRSLNRKLIDVPLYKDANGIFIMDFEAIEKAFQKESTKLFMLCSPHNPTGRLWDIDELQRLIDLVKKYDILLLSDEIWMDFEITKKHHSILKVDPSIKDSLILCTAPSKTFNLASLWTSNIIIPNPELRQRYCQVVTKIKGNHINVLGLVACETAYRNAQPWLDELLEIIRENQSLVHNYFLHNFPSIYAPISEGTYIMWIDMRCLGKNDEELEKFLEEEAHIYGNMGSRFGEVGEGFLRINVALPKVYLEKTLTRLGEALKKIV